MPTSSGVDGGHVQDPVSWVFSDMEDLSFGIFPFFRSGEDFCDPLGLLHRRCSHSMLVLQSVTDLVVLGVSSCFDAFGDERSS